MFVTSRGRGETDAERVVAPSPTSLAHDDDRREPVEAACRDDDARHRADPPRNHSGPAGAAVAVGGRMPAPIAADAAPGQE